MNTTELNVQGMTCGSCVKHVTAALDKLPGVTGVEVDLSAGRVRVNGSPDTAAFIAALDDAGYPAQPVTAPAAESDKPAGNTGKGGCCCH